jgi:hypothetical protein
LHLQIFPLHLQIFPLHLVESRILSPLAYINSATPLIHEVGKREAAFNPKNTQNPTDRSRVTTLYNLLARCGCHTPQPIWNSATYWLEDFSFGAM